MTLLLSVLIPAYNEETVIVRKLHDVFATTLPPQRFEVLVGSDGSSDRTASLAREFAIAGGVSNVRVFEFDNRGKAATLNRLMAEANGQIMLTTDADGIFGDPLLLEHLLNRFENDPCLGGISCVPVFVSNAVEQSYWRTEHAVRAFLSRRRALFVVTGMGFAFRKNAIDPVPSDIMADDLWLPLSILKNKYAMVSDDRFRASTDIFPDTRELTRKVRVVKGGMQCLARFFTVHPHMLLTPVALWVLLFKVSKWCLPFAGAVILALLALVWWPLAVAAVCSAVLGAVVHPGIRYAALGALVPVTALWQAVTGGYQGRWSHDR